MKRDRFTKAEQDNRKQWEEGELWKRKVLRGENLSGGTAEVGREGGRQSSQDLFSQSFVWASLNMDGVWSSAGASGTPQTARQAHPALLEPCCLFHLFHLCHPSFVHQLNSLSLPYFPNHTFFSDLHLCPICFCLSHSLMGKCVMLLFFCFFCCLACLLLSFPSLIFSFLLFASPFHPCFSPSLSAALHFLALCDDLVVWFVHFNQKQGSSPLFTPFIIAFIYFRWKS